jgi:protein-histidine N-methyltransferase
VDAREHALIGHLAAGADEIGALALWLVAERAAGVDSTCAPLLRSLPPSTDTPILWSDADRADLLKGSPVLGEARARDAALDAAWAGLEAGAVAAGLGEGSAPAARAAWRAAVSVVLARAAYLPSAGCFALLPLVGDADRTGAADGAVLDYDEATGSAVLSAGRAYAAGETVALYDGRPSGELVLATGTLWETFPSNPNPADCLTVDVGLVPTDRLKPAKEAILAAVGYAPARQAFPIGADRMPLGLLAYLRLARVADSAALAAVSFEADTPISAANEYEVLQLLLGECRDRLAAYAGPAEEDTKLLQQPGLAPRAALAARLRLCEKAILQGTLDAVRRRLAPIRGIPTKDGGMRAANADLLEVFDVMEGLPSLPGKLFGGLAGWARGDFDPEWKKKGGKGGGGGPPPWKP